MKNKIYVLVILFITFWVGFYCYEHIRKTPEDSQEFVYKGKVFSIDSNYTNEGSNKYDIGHHTKDSIYQEVKAVFSTIKPKLDSIYGKAQIDKELPLKITLYDDSLWYFEGTLHTDKGGVVHACISKSSGQIIQINHGK